MVARATRPADVADEILESDYKVPVNTDCLDSEPLVTGNPHFVPASSSSGEAPLARSSARDRTSVLCGRPCLSGSASAPRRQWRLVSPQGIAARQATATTPPRGSALSITALARREGTSPEADNSSLAEFESSRYRRSRERADRSAYVARAAGNTGRFNMHTLLCPNLTPPRLGANGCSLAMPSRPLSLNSIVREQVAVAPKSCAPCPDMSLGPRPRFPFS